MQWGIPCASRISTGALWYSSILTGQSHAGSYVPRLFDQWVLGMLGKCSSSSFSSPARAAARASGWSLSCQRVGYSLNAHSAVLYMHGRGRRREVAHYAGAGRGSELLKVALGCSVSSWTADGGGRGSFAKPALTASCLLKSCRDTSSLSISFSSSNDISYADVDSDRSKDLTKS